MDIIELSQAFRTARVAARLTQQDVARRAGVSIATLSRFERGELLEIGVVKLFNIFNQVGLELHPRPIGHLRTLDDIQRERKTTPSSDVPIDLGLGAATRQKYLSGNGTPAQRVRHSAKGKTRA